MAILIGTIRTMMMLMLMMLLLMMMYHWFSERPVVSGEFQAFAVG
jgi:hypothetical protein